MNLSFRDFWELLYLLEKIKVCLRIAESKDAVSLCEGILTVSNSQDGLLLKIGTYNLQVKKTGLFAAISNNTYYFTSEEKKYIMEIKLNDIGGSFKYDYEYESLCSNICESIETLNKCEMVCINSKGEINKQILMLTKMNEEKDYLTFTNEDDKSWKFCKHSISYAVSRLYDNGIMFNLFFHEGNLFIFKFGIMEVIK